MTITPVNTDATLAYNDWLSTLTDEPKPTHRIRLRIEVDLDVVLPPWMSAYDGLQAVGIVANRLDPEEVLSHIDYATDQFLPASATLASIHGDVQTLSA